MKPPPLVWFCIGVPLLTSAKDLTREQVEFFEKKVRPVLVNNCYRCHSKEATSLKGSLYLDSRSGVLSGGESDLPLSLESLSRACFSRQSVTSRAS